MLKDNDVSDGVICQRKREFVCVYVRGSGGWGRGREGEKAECCVDAGRDGTVPTPYRLVLPPAAVAAEGLRPRTHHRVRPASGEREREQERLTAQNRQ